MTIPMERVWLQETMMSSHTPSKGASVASFHSGLDTHFRGTEEWIWIPDLVSTSKAGLHNNICGCVVYRGVWGTCLPTLKKVRYPNAVRASIHNRKLQQSLL